MSDRVSVSIEDDIADVRLNRPDKLNALNDAVIDELDTAADEIEARDDVGGAILTGAGTKAFIAGADVGELSTQGPLDGKARALRGQAVLRKLESAGKPIVAAVNGFALGGGCELAMACHLRIASDNAKFGQPELKLGITPGYGGTQRLPRIVGQGRALQMILTGDPIKADRAFEIGLVNAVFPQAELLPQVREVAKKILSKGAIATALAKEAVYRGGEMSMDDGLALEADLFGVISSTDEMREGLRAFLEKRDPTWKRC